VARSYGPDVPSVQELGVASRCLLRPAVHAYREDLTVFTWIREKLGLPGALVICVIALGLVAYTAFGRKTPAESTSEERVFICAETMKTFTYTLKVGEKAPVMSPYSHKKTGYPAERCYWTRDGGAKRDPTYVLLNQYIGKEGPTICPDCGRKVVPRNPMPPRSKWRELAEKEKQAGASQGK
jgi:hypothetical protein